MKLLIVIVILLLLSTITEALPIWSQNSVSVPSDSEYSPGRNYGFEIIWTDTTGISTVILEWNGNNYTALNIGDSFYYNITDLSAGAYSYRWFANNTGGESVYSDQFSYTVEKNTSAIINLFLNGTQGNRSYNRNEIANFTASLNIPEKVISLASNYIELNAYDENSIVYKIINLTTPGLFSVSSIWNGDENYTGASKTYYFDNMPPQYSNIVTKPQDYATYAPGQIYFFNISWTDATLTEVRFESNFSGSKKNYTTTSKPKVYNEGENFWFNLTDSSAREFVYRWFAKDSLNNWTGTDQRVYRIFKGFALNLYAPFDTVVNGSTSVVNCYSLTDQITVKNFKFYRNATLIENVSMLARTDVSYLPVGFYKYECYTDGNNNYTNQTLKANLTVVPREQEKPPEIKEFKITNISSLTIKSGESKRGYFNLSSTLNETLTDISIELSGIDSGFYTIENVPSALLTGGSALIGINFNIPPEYESGLRNITIKVTAKADSGTKIATAYMILNINYEAPPSNQPPTYSNAEAQIVGEEAYISFTLYDDREVSGYILSFNETGEWINETWVPSDVADVSITRTIGPITEPVAWKIFFNDTDNAWSVSDEYIISKREEADYTVPIVIVIVSAIIAIVLYFVQKMKPREKSRKKVVYVYTKDEK